MVTESITIRDGLQNMDFFKVTELLSNAFWSPGISMEEVMKGAGNSALVVGAFLEDDSQIGYARVISDKTRFAYILDVYVDEKFRKIGVGQNMMKYILSHESLADVYQWLLLTKDAHEVYRKVGFNAISRPLDWMEIRSDRPVR
jgi:GNAT superfamily N-acetyltransferase